jgi:predicted RNase H-like nuclease
MTMQRLPYKTIAGVTPCPGGWLVLSARLAGVTVVAEDPFVLRTLAEVVDWRPKFDAVAINVPLGLYDEPTGPYRQCDEEARAMIGWPRRTAIAAVPSRAALHATRGDAVAMEPWLRQSDLRRFRWLREADTELQPFHQRSYYSAHPDLSYHQMNGDERLRTSPHLENGVIERLQLVRAKLPGAERYMTEAPPAGAGQLHVLQATGLLWTARRAAGRAMTRLPSDPTWDSTGMRMELVR